MELACAATFECMCMCFLSLDRVGVRGRLHPVWMSLPAYADVCSYSSEISGFVPFPRHLCTESYPQGPVRRSLDRFLAA